MSERAASRIAWLLDRADEAAGALEWGRVRAICEGVLRLDPENEDALVYLAAANRSEEQVARATAAAETAPAPGDREATGNAPARMRASFGGLRLLLGGSLPERAFVASLVLAVLAQWRFGGTGPNDGLPWFAAGLALVAMGAAALTPQPEPEALDQARRDAARLPRWALRLIVAAVAIEFVLLLRLVQGSDAGRDLLPWLVALVAGAVAFVRAPPASIRAARAGIRKLWPEIAFVGGLALVFLGAVIHDLGDWYYSVIGDEYLFYQWARETLDGGVIRPFTQKGVYDAHPMLATVYQAAVMWVVDSGNSGWRLSSTLAVAATIPAVYLAGRELGGRLTAASASIMFAASHYLLAYAHLGYDTAQAIAPATWAVALFLAGVRKGSALYLYLAGVAAGLGFYTFLSARVAVVVVVLALLTSPALLRRPQRWWPLAFGFALTVGPLLAVNGTGVVTGMFSEAAGGYDEGVSGDPLDRILDNLSTNLLAFNLSHHSQHYVSGSLLDALTGGAALVGLGLALGSLGRLGPRVLVLWFAVGFVATGLVSPYPYTAVSRMSLLVAPAALFAGLAVERCYTFVGSWTGSRLYGLALAAAFLGSVVVANANRFWWETPAQYHLSQDALAIGASRSALCEGLTASIVGHNVQSVLRTALESYGTTNARPVSYLELEGGPSDDLLPPGCVIFTHPTDPEAELVLNWLLNNRPGARVETFSDQAMKAQVLVIVGGITARRS